MATMLHIFCLPCLLKLLSLFSLTLLLEVLFVIFKKLNRKKKKKKEIRASKLRGGDRVLGYAICNSERSFSFI